MILSDSTQKITVSTAVAMTTAQLSYTAFVYDSDPALTSGPLVQGRGAFDVAGADIVTPPTLDAGITYPKQVMEFSVVNLDTVAHTISFKFISNIGAVDVTIFKVILQPEETIVYTKEKGWASLDANGNIKNNASNSDVPRNKTWATATSLTFDSDNYDINFQTNTEAVGALDINAPTGAPVNGQMLQFDLKSTNVQTFAWNAVFVGSVTTPLTAASSGATLTDKFFFQWNSNVSKWQLVNVKLGYT